MDTYRPDYGAPGPPGSSSQGSYGPNTPMYHFQGDTQKQPNETRRPRREFTFRAPRPKTAERPLLNLRRGNSPDLDPGVAAGAEGISRYRDVETITDSEGEDMDVSDEESNGGVPTKRVKLDNVPEEDDAPKWSNPDPYTALPPVEEGTRKRTDVVKLIRKARVAASSTDNMDVDDTGDDFISFGDLGDLDGQDAAPANAPTGPRAAGDRKRKRADDDDGPAGQLYNIRGVAFHENAAILNKWRSNGDPAPWYKGSLSHSLQHPLMSLHAEVVDFYEWVRPKDYEHAVRSELIARLEQALRNTIPGCEVRAFGSFAAGLYLPTGDMDLVVFSSDFLNAKRTGRPFFGKHTNSWYFRVSAGLERQGIPAGKCTTIPKARVPLIKFVDRISGIKVDLSFDNETGVIANKTFQRWKLQYPAMPIIVSVIKNFLMIRGLNDNAAGGLGGFSTICLVTSLIQMLPHDVGTPNLGRMLVEFFNLYGNLFNRYDLGIRMEPPGYFEKRSYRPFVLSDNKAERLSIIDPNNPDNDISGGSRHVDIIFKAFNVAYEKLRVRLESIASNGSSEASILAEVIGGNYEYYDSQRVHLKKVYDTTHRNLNQSYVPPPPPPIRPPPIQAKPPPPPPIAPVQPRPQAQRPNPPSLAASLPRPVQIDGPPPDDFVRPPPNLRTAANLGESGATSNNTTTRMQTRQSRDSASSRAPQPSATKPPSDSTDSTKSKTMKKSERRAARLKELRPDISNVPKATSIAEAVKLGGYSNGAHMTRDLDRRSSLVAAGADARKISMIEHKETDSTEEEDGSTDGKSVQSSAVSKKGSNKSGSKSSSGSIGGDNSASQARPMSDAQKRSEVMKLLQPDKKPKDAKDKAKRKIRKARKKKEKKGKEN